MKIFFFKFQIKSNQIKLNQTSMLVTQFTPQPGQQSKEQCQELRSTLLSCLGERQLKLYPIFIGKQSYEPKHIKII
jgi:hypothetical protein